MRAINRYKNHGERADSGFKRELFKHVADVVNLTVEQDQRRNRITARSIKTKLTSLKQEWKNWHEMLSQSRFGIDLNTGLPTALKEVLDAYFKVYPACKKFVKKALPFVVKLDQLFADTTATREHVISIEAMLNGPVALVEGSLLPETPRAGVVDSLEANISEVSSRKRVIYEANLAAKRRRQEGQNQIHGSISQSVKVMTHTAELIASPLTLGRALSSLLFLAGFTARSEELADLTLRQKKLLYSKITTAEEGTIIDIFLSALINAQQAIAVALINKNVEEFEALL